MADQRECLCPPTIVAMAGHEADCPVAEPSANGNGRPVSRRVNSPVKRPGIPRHRQLEVIRHLAAEDITRAELARQVGITRGGMTSFAKRHQAEIEQVRAQLEDEFAGIWLASKRNRLAALQSDYELAAEHKNAAHYQWILARAQLMHQASEELGQLPGRGAVVIIPVVHELVGVDLDALT
jgi:hypothetical protein